MLTKDVYINALGGDCPGKTELEKSLVEESSIVVEYFEQSKIEGEIQQISDYSKVTELHEIINKSKVLNVKTDGTIIFDSVGFALEDYSILRLFYALAQRYNLGEKMNLVPEIKDVKNLFSLLKA